MASWLFIFAFVITNNYDTAQILGLDECNSCHSGTISENIQTAFSVEDPDNAFAEIDEYVPGNTYRLHLRMTATPSGGDYRVAYRLGVFDQQSGDTAQGELGEPAAPADFEFNDDDSYVAAIIDTDQEAEAEDLFINWTAPENGFGVVFVIARVESNVSDSPAGDRGSTTEVYALAGPESGSSTGSGSGGGSGGDGSGDEGDSDGSSGSAFGSGFSAGCQLVLDKSSAAHPFLCFVLGILLLGILRRKA